MMYNNKHIRYRVITPKGEYICLNMTQVSAYCNCSVNKLNKAFIGYEARINGCVVIRETDNWILAESGNYKYTGLSLLAYIGIVVSSFIVALILCEVML